MIEIRQSFETNQEAKVAMNYHEYFNVLYELDDWLRTQMKYHPNLSGDTYDAYDECRDKLRGFMEANGVSLLDAV